MDVDNPYLYHLLFLSLFIMKIRNYIIGSTFAFALVVVATVIAVPSVSAYQGDPLVKAPNHSPERHVAMTAAFEARDYSAWKNLMGGRGATRNVNESNFSRFAEANALARSGDLEEAKAMRAELGLGLRNGQGRGQGGGQGGGNRLEDGTGNGPRNGTGPRSMNGDCTFSG